MQFVIHEGQVSCKTLLAKYSWIQFPDEKNRWHLEEKWSEIPFEELIGEPAETVVHKTTGSSLMIHIVRFPDGGVISYKREDEKFLHTLNTLSMFKRKLWDLGLWTPGEE